MKPGWPTWALPLAALMVGIASPQASAQPWPVHPIKLVVPFAPGGATDIIGRVVAHRLGERLGQPVVVENKPGAGTTIGNAAVAKAAPDGYTLLLAPTPFVISQVMYPSLPYDAQKDFTPVALIAVSPFILVVNPAVPVKTVPELVALAKAKPGSLAYASAGNGTVPHLSGELFRLHTGVDIVHVPYKGGGPAIVDLLSGQVAMMFATPIEVIQHVEAGKLRVIATTASTRLVAMPDVPTVRESGYPDFDAYAFFGVLAPAGTPKDIVNRIAGELAKTMDAADVRERLASQSAIPQMLPPEAFAAYLVRERDKWDNIVKRSGATLD